MSSGVSCPASPFPTTTVSSPLCKSLNSFTYFSSNLVIPRTLCSSEPKLKGIRCTGGRDSRNNRVRCNSSIRPGGPGSDNNESRSVLNAFFLGKALAEAINERVESTVGEVLSAIGRLQTEQQKQVQDFQVNLGLLN
ncbi:chromatin modification-related protein EAF1 A-like [Quillaja saponaria]|uniref:Chromatin modification-related protein EAF1 A-like n=1 Tax=Quillaja saponaria TaxID=32244 RepID=A0AAD7LP50_QUISA|nr:chromatin modification-related protein EAF1 A-like [Quillaja saponaria]